MDVRLPDGTVIKNVPDGTSKADLVTKLKANGMNVPDSWAAPASAPKPQGSAFDGLMNMIKGGGEAAMHLGSSALATPVAGLAGLGQAANNALGVGDGTPASDAVANAQEALTYRPRSDAGKATVDLVSKPLGYVGEKINDAGQAASDATGSPAYGAATSAVATALPDMLGLELPALGKSKIAAAKQAAVDSAPRQAQIQQAKDAGYHIPPSEITSAPAGKALTGVAGKDQLNQSIALVNQANTNKIARTEAQIPSNVPLTPTSLETAATQAGGAYAAVKRADSNMVPVLNGGQPVIGPSGKPMYRPAGPIRPDAQLATDLQNVGVDRTSTTLGPGLDPQIAKLKQAYANATSAFTPKDALDNIKNLRSDARANLKATDDPGKLNLGRAQQQTADAFEDRVERYLNETGQANLYTAFTAARTRLAKIDTIREAMSADGKVDATAINRYRNNGGYVAGGLKQIADAADSFSNVVKNTQRVQDPAPFSKLGFYAAMMGGGAGLGAELGGHYGAGAAAALTLPPIARKALNSGVYQRTLGAQTPTASALSQLAAKPASPFEGLLMTPDQGSDQ